MDRKRALPSAVARLALAGLSWFLWAEARRSWAAISSFTFRVKPVELAAAFALATASFLLDTAAWQRATNTLLGRRELHYAESVAAVNASGLLKYLPGRVWSYAAQMMWLLPRGISGALIVYVNLLCILC